MAHFLSKGDGFFSFISMSARQWHILAIGDSCDFTCNLSYNCTCRVVFCLIWLNFVLSSRQKSHCVVQAGLELVFPPLFPKCCELLCFGPWAEPSLQPWLWTFKNLIWEQCESPLRCLEADTGMSSVSRIVVHLSPGPSSSLKARLPWAMGWFVSLAYATAESSNLRASGQRTQKKQESIPQTPGDQVSVLFSTSVLGQNGLKPLVCLVSNSH